MSSLEYIFNVCSMGSEARISTELLPTRIKIHPGGRADPRNFAPLHHLTNVHEALGRRPGCQVGSYRILHVRLFLENASLKKVWFSNFGRKFEIHVSFSSVLGNVSITRFCYENPISESRVLLHGYYPNSAEGAKKGPPESHIGYIISTPID